MRWATEQRLCSGHSRGYSAPQIIKESPISLMVVETHGFYCVPWACKDPILNSNSTVSLLLHILSLFLLYRCGKWGLPSHKWYRILAFRPQWPPCPVLYHISPLSAPLSCFVVLWELFSGPAFLRWRNRAYRRQLPLTHPYNAQDRNRFAVLLYNCISRIQ